ncbi:Raf kinase inhibitor-like YbhB/YbcL family protein [Paraburkholderia terricola]|jgi:Raf kinase inhibitor-like YbhB/YbcL family protein|nr:Raf kinase inhibitor-like YbhB/YbcL family protein [Paraburkholderia terricola]
MSDFNVLNTTSRALNKAAWTSAPRGLLALLLIALIFPPGPASTVAAEERAMTLTLTSQAFQQNGEIPPHNTCQGADVSPPLTWSGVPSNAKSLALIVDDPDAPDPAAPKMTWVHWVLYNIPPTAIGLSEGAAAGGLPRGTLEGTNDFKRAAYGGPCPPVGRHRYFHKLYALDTVLPDLKSPSKAALEKAMQGHLLAHAELIGTYQKR